MGLAVTWLRLDEAIVGTTTTRASKPAKKNFVIVLYNCYNNGTDGKIKP